MKLNEALSIRLNEFMKMKHLNPYKISRMTGLTITNIQRILNCQNEDVKLSTLILFAHALGMNISELLDDKIFEFENLEFYKF